MSYTFMKSRHTSLIIILSFIFGVFLLYPSYSLAGIGVTVAPVKYNIDADPGEIIEDTITVANPNETDLKVRAELQDFKVTEENNIQWLPGDIENPYKMSDWIRIRQDVITLKPQGEARVPFKIFVPRNATAGGHYAAVFFTGILEAEDGNVGAVPRVGALVILNVNGDLKKSGQLIKFSGPRLASQGPVKFNLSFLNTGTTHYEIKADIALKNFFWSSGNFSSETKIVYPNIKRDLPAVWDKKFLLGVYKAKATVIDGDGVIHQKSLIFVGFPYRWLAILIAIIVILWLLGKWFKKKFKLVRV